MADDPSTKAGRAAMAAKAAREQREAAHAAEVWAKTQADVEALQRRAGDID